MKEDCSRARVAVAAVMMMMAGSLAPAAAQTPVQGGTLVLAIGGDPPTVNPDVSTGIPDQLIGCMVYQGLVKVSVDSEIEPLLARSWTVSPDGLTYRFELVDAQWQDGQPFTSEDVKYSLTEVSAKFGSIFAPAGRAIDNIDASDPHVAVIKLKHSFGPFLFSMSCPVGGAIMPAHLFRGTEVPKNPATLSNPVGTGAFMLKDWMRGDHLTLVRNPHYWEKDKPHLDQIIAKEIPEGSARMLALQSGDVDIVTGYFFPANNIPTAAANPALRLEPAGFAPSDDMLMLNTTRPPFDNVKVRQAAFLAIDRDFLLKNVWFGTGTVGVSSFDNRIKWAYNPAIDYSKLYPYDPARARTLLDEAGLKPGVDGMRATIHLVLPSDAPDRVQAAEALKRMWGAVGLNVAIDTLERTAEVKRAFVDRDFDVTFQGYTSYGDPALGIARTYVSSSIGKPFGNPSGYANPEVDKLFEAGQNATQPEDRAKPYRAVQEILARDLPTLVIHQQAYSDVTTKRLYGVWGGQGYGLWENAWLTKE
jgi:peptide/nickel transport system substrate-binding protein